MNYQAIQMIGTQRSGSNLLRLMLNQLSDISAPHPPHILERLMPLLPVYGDLHIPENFEILVDDACRLVETNPVAWTGVILNRRLIAESCKTPSLTEIMRIIYELKAAADNATSWMCKSMASIHYADQLEAHIKPLYLHLYRDGRDVACSFRKAIVGEKHIYHLARQWKQEQDLSLALMDQLGSDRVIQVKYEELLTHPEKEMQRLCHFLGIRYNAAAMEYHVSEEAKNTASSGEMWQNVQQPVMTDNHNKYRKELSTEDIRLFEEVAGDTLVSLGYTPDNPGYAGRLFSEAERASFDELNKEMKRQARLKQKPEDLQKRSAQDALLNEIKERVRSHAA